MKVTEAMVDAARDAFLAATGLSWIHRDDIRAALEAAEEAR